MESLSGLELDWPWAFVALFSCALLIVFAIWRRHELRPSTIAWALPFAGITAFLAAWCAQGLCVIDAGTFCAYQLLCAALGIVVLNRDRIVCAIRRGIDALAPKHAAAIRCALRWIRDAALLALVAHLSFLSMEIADNPEWAAIDGILFNRGLTIVAIALLALYFLGQRRGALCLLIPIACAIFGLVQNFLDLFKNTALLPSDVMAWQTAAAVSGGYTYILPKLAITSIVYAIVAIAALAFIGPHAKAGRKLPDAPGAAIEQRAKHARHAHTHQTHHAGKRAIGIAANLACCALCVFGINSLVNGTDYQETFDIHLDYWDLRTSYHKNGFLVSFIAATQDLSIDKPEGYIESDAMELQDALARKYDETLGKAHTKAHKQFDLKKPCVIAIMNESYSDLSLFEDLYAGYTSTYVTGELKAPIKGWLNMSVHGGGTCNSEYEFLASSSMGFLSSGMYPYQQFDFSRINALPAQFRQLGYTTWAMHPNYPGNWNREFVYTSMGVDTSLFIYDFEGADEFHGCVSDRATYDRALEIIENANENEPQFVLDITMQNHGGYDTGTIPADQMLKISPDFLDADATFQLDEFLSCIKESDDALKYLLKRLSAMDRPVAVVFFGDHQPSLSRDYNDALFPDEEELVHKARITKTPYFIWTNYDIPGWKKDVEVESSANYLAAQFLELIGAPLDPYQKAALVLHEDVHAVNTNGFSDSEDKWHDPADGETADHPYRELQDLHYLNVASKL